MVRKLWWLKVEEDGVYLHLTDSPESEGKKLSYQQTNKEKQHRMFTSVVQIEPYYRKGREEDTKFFFKSKTDVTRAFRKVDFLWNKEGPFLGIKGSSLSIVEFAAKLNDVLVKETEKLNTNPANSEQHDMSEADTYEFSDQLDDLSSSSTLSTSFDSRAGTSKRRKLSSQLSGEIPLLHKKIDETEESDVDDEKIKTMVRQAYLGTAKVPISHLNLGPLLRDINTSFVEDLKGRMMEFPNHCYQPLCVLTSNVESKDDFRETTASGYQYNVIGGCHNFVAAKDIYDQHPELDLFKTRLCVIFHQNLSHEAVLWLANKHNEIGAQRHLMTVKEKIQLCHNLKENYVDATDKWKETCSMILNEPPRTVNLYCSLANFTKENFDLLMRNLNMFERGELKGQKLKRNDIAGVPDLKIYIFRDLVNLPPAAITLLLKEVCNKKMGLGDLKTEAKCLSRLNRIQQKFLELMDISTWEEAIQQFPHETTREVLAQFMTLPLNGVPSELRTFCRRLRRGASEDDLTPPTGDIAAELSIPLSGLSVYFTKANVEDISLNMVKENCPNFHGFDCTILDMPKHWTTETCKKFFTGLTALNLDVNLTDFKLAVLYMVSQMDVVMEALSSFKDFNMLFRAYYNVCDIQTVQTSIQGEPLDSVFGMVIAMTKRDQKEFKWSNGYKGNFLATELGKPFKDESNAVIDESQKPIGLYRELVGTLSMPRQWVLDACCGTGTGVIASLRQGRNAVGMDMSERMLKMSNVRLAMESNTELVSKDQEKVEASASDTQSGDAPEDPVWDDMEDDILAAELDLIEKEADKAQAS